MFSPVLLFIYLLLAVLGLCCWARFSLVVVSRGYSVVHGLLTAVALPAAERGCMGSVAVAPWL